MKVRAKFIIDIETDFDTNEDVEALKYIIEDDLGNKGYIVYSINEIGNASVVELADTTDLSSVARKSVGVQLPPEAPNQREIKMKKEKVSSKIDLTVDEIKRLLNVKSYLPTDLVDKLNKALTKITSKKIKIKCDFCGKEDDTVHEDIDPYSIELYDDYGEHYICDECYTERRRGV